MISTIFESEVYSDESVVWRYMDFSKFVDLLDSSCLFFPRLTVLRKLDPYEGSFIPFGSHDKKDDKEKRLLKGLDKILPRQTFVNCWYLSDVESAALWKLFPKSDEGIAVMSNIERLRKSVESKSGQHTIYMGSVTYGHERIIERKTEIPKSYNGDDAVFTKRACFEHERELRLVIYANDIKTPILHNQNGLKLLIDLESLISELIISPEAPYWIKDLAGRVTKKYGFSFKITQSTLNRLPF